MAISASSFISQLHSVLTTELETAHSVCVAVALLSEHGVKQLRQHLPAEATVELLVGLDLPTRPAALTQLLNWSREASGIHVRVWATQAAYFHPKVYLVEQANGWVAFVGSANCTESGWQHNEELTARVADATAADLRRDWFAPRFAAGVPLTAEFIEEYSTSFAARAAADAAARAVAKEAQQHWQKWLQQQQAAIAAEAVTVTGLGRPVRPGQYFREEHYAAFDGTKPRDRTAAANRERYAVYKRMKQLHEQLQPQVAASGWDLHPHYVPEHVVSSWEHGPYVEDAIRAIWLNYGRSGRVIKSTYGEHLTPKPFIRLQVILFNNHLATWCRMGKDCDFDREAFKEKMQSVENQGAYFALLHSLGGDFFIEVRNVKRPANSFTDASELVAFVRDDKRGHYFIVGHDYQPNDPAISESNLIQTVMDDWKHLYQVYQWMKRPDR